MTRSDSTPLAVGAFLVVMAMVPAMATAQPVVHPLEVFGTLGVGQVFIDTDFPDHSVAGGGVRLRLSPRWAVQGDLLSYLWNDPLQRFEARHGSLEARVSSLTLVGTDTSDTARVRLYWLAGISMPVGSHSVPAVLPTLGLGARIFLSDRYFVAPEVRSGGGPLFRASVSGGIALGAR